MVDGKQERELWFFSELVGFECQKMLNNYSEYCSVREHPDTVLVRAPIMYDLYRVLVDPDCSRLRFNSLFKEKLYYDKYECDHGIEFYYYVKFNKYSTFYNNHKGFINRWIEVNDIYHYDDVKRLIPAMTKEGD